MEAIVDSDSSHSDSTTYSDFVREPIKKKHKCTFEDCNKSFYRPSKLADHLRRHLEERPFICENENCRKAYHKKDALKKHQKAVHLKETKNALCAVDGCLRAMRKENLERHVLRKHNNYRKFKFSCPQCRKGFRNESELKNHSTEHSEVYKCHVCQKVFQKGHRFNRHIKSHKNYKCSCEKEFFDFNKFRSHKKSCGYIEPQCKLCGQKFVTKSNLKKHYEYIHGDKQSTDKFKCTYEGCTKEYNYKRNLNMHERVFHLGENKDESLCNTCGKVFKTNEYLKKHIKKCHLNPIPKEPKLRKPRFDKGIPKISMITQITGIELTKEDNRNRMRLENEAASEKLESILKNNYLLTIENDMYLAEFETGENMEIN